MLINLTCTLSLLLFVCLVGKSQNFMHGVGGTISIMTAKISNPSERYTATVAFTNLTYFPRYTLTESDRTSLSIGAPVGAGVGFQPEGVVGRLLFITGLIYPWLPITILDANQQLKTRIVLGGIWGQVLDTSLPTGQTGILMKR